MCTHMHTHTHNMCAWVCVGVCGCVGVMCVGVSVRVRCLCMNVCVCLICVCLAFRVMLNDMTKVSTPLLASSSSLGRPVGAPRVFFNSKYLFLSNSIQFRSNIVLDDIIRDGHFLHWSGP